MGYKEWSAEVFEIAKNKGGDGKMVRVVVWTDRDYKEAQQATVYIAIEKSFLEKMRGFGANLPAVLVAGERLKHNWGYKILEKHKEIFEKWGFKAEDFRYRELYVNDIAHVIDNVDACIEKIKQMKDWLDSKKTIKQFCTIFYV